jgi:hypothetical protein
VNDVPRHMCTMSRDIALVELRGFEPPRLPGKTPVYLRFRSVSFQFSPARYLRFCSRVLTASRAIITNTRPGSGRDPSADRHEWPLPVLFRALHDPFRSPEVNP